MSGPTIARVRREVRLAAKRVAEELRANGDGKFGRGLSNEGFAGGYAAALRDVELRLIGYVIPTTRDYWQDLEEPKP